MTPKAAEQQRIPLMQTSTPVPNPPVAGAPGPLAAPPYEVPGGTSELAWNIAAAWSDSSVEELLAETAPVKSAHYLAGLRATKVFSDWLLREDAAAEAHAVAADVRWWSGKLPGLPVQDDPDPFARVMVLAEEMAAMTATARNSGDAAKALKYSTFEQSLLQVAAGLQLDNDTGTVKQ
ncbi:hypothetical protein [Arthrobacter glacialis]|uniref:hypothetical protein n=1 Tax=Arthrobacter glacialis TaxID=1664 RepID=UPI000CD49B20|nr:hypothetical protein [Arthrobacter glacialis]POH58893.1 hypothetical protein CVS28_09295 [Arthrobacter glacialis]